jgi:hypothetical protein
MNGMSSWIWISVFGQIGQVNTQESSSLLAFIPEIWSKLSAIQVQLCIFQMGVLSGCPNLDTKSLVIVDRTARHLSLSKHRLLFSTMMPDSALFIYCSEAAETLSPYDVCHQFFTRWPSTRSHADNITHHWLLITADRATHNRPRLFLCTMTSGRWHDIHNGHTLMALFSK